MGSSRKGAAVLALVCAASFVAAGRSQTGGATSGPARAASQKPAADKTTLVPADKGFTMAQLAALRGRGSQRVYAGTARTTLGMPCGGICAGQLYVLGDGALGCWQIDGRLYATGYGSENYRTFRPEQPIAQGFALAVRDAAGQVTRATLDESGYDAIEFVGEYPRALIRYRNRASAVREVPPVVVDLEVFSPFVPLDARNSAWPATVLHFTLSNPSDQALTVALGGWLENMVFGEQADPIGLRRRNAVVPADSRDLTAVVMDAIEERLPAPARASERILADFESGTYAGWHLQGSAFGEAPAEGAFSNQQPVRGFGGRYLVNSYHGDDQATGRLTSDEFTLDLPFLLFRIGGGAHAGKTCLNLVVNGTVVRTATGQNKEDLEQRIWDVRKFLGQTARLEIVDEASGAWGHINVDDLVLTNTLPAGWREYDPAGLGFGSMALTYLGTGHAVTHWGSKARFLAGLFEPAPPPDAAKDETKSPVGAVTAELELAPGASRDATFIVSWYFPNLHTGHGRMYTNWFTDAQDVAQQLARQLPELHKQTRRFCDVYYRETTLPWWLNTRLLMPMANLATGTAQWWRDGRFWGWEGVGCCTGTCTHVYNYAQGDAWLFPELARSTRTMQDLGAGFEETSGLVGFRSNREFAADGQAGTVLKCYREHLTSADDTYLRKYWSRIKAALEYLISNDDDERGIITNDWQHNTYDINFVGPNTFVGALYLAALRAGEEMARRMDDSAAAERYHAIFERGRQWTAANLFNGEYFEQRVPLAYTAGAIATQTAPAATSAGAANAPTDMENIPKGVSRELVADARAGKWQYGTGCLADQLFGQNWAHVLDLGYVYPPEQVRAALASIYRYNWTPDVETLNAKHPPERWFARPGEPGLFICTWPRGGRAAEPVRYRDEVWTGCEYQVAAGLLWEGLADARLADAALTIVQGIEERYDGTKHNPWNEVECGDHYARAMASWGVLHALAGFTWDGPAGRLAFAPRIQADDFQCFFAAGTGWGTIAQKRMRLEQTNEVRGAWGRLRIAELVLTIPEHVQVGTGGVVVDSGTEEFTASVAVDGTRFRVRFTPAREIAAGESISTRIPYRETE